MLHPYLAWFYLISIFQSLGGRVETKVPRQGYILVQPGTTEEERLRLCWMAPDRPERHFVPYTYVQACKIAGMQLKQIFVENGLPIKMHIHPSIANINARAILSERIMVSMAELAYFIVSSSLRRLSFSTLEVTLLHLRSLQRSSLQTRTPMSFNILSRHTKAFQINMSSPICG